MSRPLPGPRSLRAQIGVARAMQRDPRGALLELAATYGPVAQIGFGKYRYVLVFGVEANEYVLQTAPSNFTWREAFWPLVVIDGETALVVSDGDDHKRRKAVVLPAFHRRRIASYFDVMVDETNRVLEGWRPGDTVDAYASLRLAVRRIVLRCLFGDAFGDREQTFIDLLEVPRAYANRTPLQRFDNERLFPPYRRAMRARRAMDAMVFDEIARRRAAGTPGDDVLGWLIGAQDDEGPGLSDQEVRDQVISLIAAAYDTTSSALGWIAMRLADDEALRSSVRAEVAAVTGGAALTIEHLPSLKLTAGVVNEVMRIQPPAIVSVRHVVAPFELHGHTVPGGGLLMYSSYVTQMDPDHFPDPDTFKPTRWIEGHADHRPHHPYAYVPFGGGGRRCLGFAFALQEMTVMAALMAMKDFEPAYAVPPTPAGIASMAPRGGVPVRVA
jgi:cytochrome P450